MTYEKRLPPFSSSGNFQSSRVSGLSLHGKRFMTGRRGWLSLICFCPMAQDSILSTSSVNAPHCRKLVLSARSDLDLKLEAYRRGADAYLIKPIDLQELAALIQASLKRAEPLAPENHWSIDTAALRLRGPRGETVSVSLQEARVLTLMAESVRHFASRRDLIEAMGFEHSQYDEQRLEAMISRLRRKLTPLGDKPIKAVHGQGYVFTQKIVAEVLTG